ncbi:MAG: hypothetical protein AAGD05_03100 [Bacteroidota bacterium]
MEYTKLLYLVFFICIIAVAGIEVIRSFFTLVKFGLNILWVFALGIFLTFVFLGQFDESNASARSSRAKNKKGKPMRPIDHERPDYLAKKERSTPSSNSGIADRGPSLPPPIVNEPVEVPRAQDELRTQKRSIEEGRAVYPKAGTTIDGQPHDPRPCLGEYVANGEIVLIAGFYQLLENARKKIQKLKKMGFPQASFLTTDCYQRTFSKSGYMVLILPSLASERAADQTILDIQTHLERHDFSPLRVYKKQVWRSDAPTFHQYHQ